MFGIVLLLLAGVVPALSQFQQFQQQHRFSDYGDYGAYNKGNQRGSDFGLQQQSFYGLSNNNGDSGERSGNSGATGLSAPENTGNVNNNQQYFNNPRHAIVPSSLRELEESYIRSLSTSSTTQPYLDPFGENREVLPQQQQHPRGVESFSGFIPTNRRQPFVHSHYNKNEHLAAYRNQQQFQEHHHQQQQRQQPQQNRAQSAPITYGFPLVNQQISSTNSLESAYDQNHQVSGSGRYYDYPEKNNVPNFPDFTGPPPIPEEPYIPPASELESTGKPPEKLIIPKEPDLDDYGSKVSPTPLASPPPVFDPTFPERIMQRGFIPSFGPPTKEPLGKHGTGKDSPVISEPVHNHIQSVPSPSEVNSSPIPILRPEYPKDKERNILPDELPSEEVPEANTRKGKVFKHVSVHVAPEDLDDDVSAPRIVKIAKKPEKHLKVIFIKPPETPTTKTEVDLPPSPEHRTLVYLLSESGGARNPIKLIKPPLKPIPPEVFFLRYKDSNTGTSHPHISSESEPSSQSQPSSESADDSSDGEEPTGPPEIKDLTSPLDPDAELLRSAPPPVIPTFSTFSSPATTSISQLAFQTTLTSPTAAFTNYNNPSINYPQTGVHQNSINNNDNDHHLSAFTTTNPTNFPNTMQPPASTNPFSSNYYSALYHLYPPPTLTNALPNQNLIPMYFNPLQQQFHQPPFVHSPYAQFLNVDQSKSGTEPQSSSIQGLYSVAPYVQNPQGINYNSLLQNPDGKRPPRNFVMMTYAPTYTPTASGSEHAPVFTSPAALIKSLLGDSYMYYNNIGNNTLLGFTNKNSSALNVQTSPIPIAAFIKAYDHSHSVANGSISPSPSAHTLPLILNLEYLQNLSRPPDHHKQSPPHTIVLGSTYGTSEQVKSHVHRSVDHYPFPGPQPLFPSTSSTTTTTHQPRLSFPVITTVLPRATSSTTTKKQIIHLPVIIYDNSKGHPATPSAPNVTTADSVAAHFSKILQSIDFNRNESFSTDMESSAEGSFSGHPGSSSNSEETREIAQLSTESNEEEVAPIYFEPSKSNSSSLISNANNGTIVFVNNNNNSTRPGSRKRVNPARVKPGRRLRKVRKPPKNSKNKSGNSSEQEDKSSS